MTESPLERAERVFATDNLPTGEREEPIAPSRLISEKEARKKGDAASGRRVPMTKQSISVHSVLNEAYDYGAAISRGLRLEFDHR